MKVWSLADYDLNHEAIFDTEQGAIDYAINSGDWWIVYEWEVNVPGSESPIGRVYGPDIGMDDHGMRLFGPQVFERVSR